MFSFNKNLSFSKNTSSGLTFKYENNASRKTSYAAKTLCMVLLPVRNMYVMTLLWTHEYTAITDKSSVALLMAQVPLSLHFGYSIVIE